MIKYNFKNEFSVSISHTDVAIENRHTVEVALWGQCQKKENEMKKIYVKAILFICVCMKRL